MARGPNGTSGPPPTTFVKALGRARHVVLSTGATGEVAELILAKAREVDRIYATRRRDRNHDEMAAYHSAWMAAHPDERRSYYRKYNATRDQTAYRANYYATHREEIRAKHAAYRAAKRFESAAATEPRILKLDDLTPAQRRVVLALIGPTEQGKLTSH